MKFNSQAWQYSYPGFMCDVVTQRGTSMSGDTLMIEPVASSMFFHFFVLRIYHSLPLQKEEVSFTLWQILTKSSHRFLYWLLIALAFGIVLIYHRFYILVTFILQSELSPEKIDEALITQVVSKLKK